jgi:site-specific DNA-cytosine methylase
MQTDSDNGVLTHISMCSGYGGIDLALKRLFKHVKTVALCEQETYVVANLISKMERGWLDVAPIWTNLQNFPFGKFKGLVNILSGGMPCQPFSNAGLKGTSSDSRFLYPSFSEGIALCEPDFVLIENVLGLVSSSFKEEEHRRTFNSATKNILLYILQDLERLGYRSYFVLSDGYSAGLPVQRRRVFIVGIQKNIDLEVARGFFTDTTVFSLELSPQALLSGRFSWQQPFFTYVKGKA